MWNLKDVVSVYSGKAGKCMCGCSGKHTYASAHREWASKNRGYAIDDDEVSDRTVKIIFNKLLKIGPPNALDDGRIIFAENGERTYTVYFKEEE
jgi:hypothetical protein